MEGATEEMLRQQEPGPAEGLCDSFSTGQSLPVTLASPQQADLSLLSVLSPGCSKVGMVHLDGTPGGHSELLLSAGLAWPQEKLQWHIKTSPRLTHREMVGIFRGNACNWPPILISGSSRSILGLGKRKAS